jgi:hypothetical protein
MSLTVMNWRRSKKCETDSRLFCISSTRCYIDDNPSNPQIILTTDKPDLLEAQLKRHEPKPFLSSPYTHF